MNLNSFLALLEDCKRKAWVGKRGRIVMAGTRAGGYGSRGSDNNEERLRKMVADHLRLQSCLQSTLEHLKGWHP